MNARADYTRTENPATIDLAEKRAEYRAKGITDERRWAIEQLRNTFSEEGYKGEKRWALNFQTAAVARFGPAAGIFLRQLLFWADKGHDNEGWIYKRREEWHTETGLGIRDLQRARRVLRGEKPWGDKEALSVMEERRPSRRAPMEYRLDLRATLEALLPESSYRTTEMSYRSTESSYRSTESSYEPPESSYGAAIHREQQESTAETTSKDTPLQGAVEPPSAPSPAQDVYEIKDELPLERGMFVMHCWRYLEAHPDTLSDTPGGTVSASDVASKVLTHHDLPTAHAPSYEEPARTCIEAYRKENP